MKTISGPFFLLSRLMLPAASLVLCVTATADLIQNGSFEDGNFVPNVGGVAMQLFPGSIDITGWVIVQGQVAWALSGCLGPGIYASDGDKYLDLSGWSDVEPYGGVTLQTAIATVPGHEYSVGFDLGSDTRWTPSAPSVLIQAGSASAFLTGTLDGLSHWDHLLFEFVAESSSTVITITGEPPPTANWYLGLDNISLSANDVPVGVPVGVPDAGSTSVMLLTALGMMSWLGATSKRP